MAVSPYPLLGDIQPGDPVIITDPNRKGVRIDGRVLKVARVWITLQAAGYGRTWRMRRDTQSESTGYGWGGLRFVTAEQDAWNQRYEEADAYLAELGIEFRSGRLWSAPEKRIQLADMIRAATEGTVK